MPVLMVAAPAYFRSFGPVVLETADGRPFYAKGEPCVFSLPAGVYRVKKGRIDYVRDMEPREPVDLPAIGPLPASIRVRWGRVRDKARINTGTGQIWIDRRYKSAPDFVLAFIFAHEIGHLFFKSEKGADAFACDYMHAKGYNPSQIEAAARLSLSRCSDRVGAVSRFAHKKGGTQ